MSGSSLARLRRATVLGGAIGIAVPFLRGCYLRWGSTDGVEPVQLVSFIMSERMLRGIRWRAHRGKTLTDLSARVSLPPAHRGSVPA